VQVTDHSNAVKDTCMPKRGVLGWEIQQHRSAGLYAYRSLVQVDAEQHGSTIARS
jgi:hypothetical protein